ncbi:hypothetical protein ACFFWC_24610 [Plantactinospora siamensis]|uniref:Uncharacterized protein n=1 Tax=Plantactinospora siamensis TaxID=555372 RepID=A0ABV6P7Z2_9ACTN
MARRINRLVYKTVFVLGVLASLAFAHNTAAHPCTGASVGAGGMCVSTSWAGGAS